MAKIRKMGVRELFEEQGRVDDCLVYSSKKDPNLEIINELAPSKQILSLGCGGGREIKELVSRGHRVIAVDISQRMIDSSKKIEPRAEYHCMDAVKFARANKNKMKLDYILGLYAFLGYIDNLNRKELVENLMSMLKKDGTMIFELRRFTESPKYIFKALIAPLFALYFGDNWKLGDVYGRNAHDLRAGWHKGHHFTDSELKKLFKNYALRVRDNKVYVRHRRLTNL